MDKFCRNCGHGIRIIKLPTYEDWMHVKKNAPFPTRAKGTAWIHCKLQVAAPAEE